MSVIESDDMYIDVELIANLHWKTPAANRTEEQYRIDQQTKVNVFAHDLETKIRNYITNNLKNGS